MEPPADKNELLFLHLVSLFQFAALQQMGKVKNPVTDAIERDLAQARTSIDMLEMLSLKTKGNLSREQEKLLSGVLQDLRLNFVDEVNKNPAEPATPAPPASEPPPQD
jgi:hypothetical protein